MTSLSLQESSGLLGCVFPSVLETLPSLVMRVSTALLGSETSAL